jgi:arylsulfatase
MNRKPNILMIMTDQQRWDSLGCYGVDYANTPNLDRMAEQGAVFENCYVSNPVCTPSRASIMTGKHIYGHGVYRLYDDLPDDEVLLPAHLGHLGYQTALIGKLHVSSHTTERDYRHPNDGFDIYEMCHEASYNMESKYQSYARWLKEKSPDFYQKLKTGVHLKNVPEEFHMTHWAAERTIDFINKHDGEKPFFCKMSVFDPHDPYDDYPDTCADLVKSEDIPDPLCKRSNNEPVDIDRERKDGCGGGPYYDSSIDEIRKLRHGYHVSIAFLDREVGKVLDALERRKLTENTVVIFTSDHGDMLGDHDLLTKGAFFYDACTKVPLLIRWPEKIAPGQRIEDLAQNLDLAATILAIAGMESDEIKSLMPEAYDLLNEKDHRTAAFCAYRNTGICRISADKYFSPEINATMVRDEHYKYNCWHNNMTDKSPGEELYDMQNDPQEINNLCNDSEYTEIKIKLKKQLDEFLSIEKSSRGRNNLK